MDKTRERLVLAATRLFAEHGLDGVTIREICTAAKVNTALVNYHFRNKEGLYRECVERIYRYSGGLELKSLVAKVKDERSWQEAVRTWVNRFSSAINAIEGGEALAGGIYRQEVVRPSAMHNVIMKNYAVPVRDALLELMHLAGLKEDEAYRWAASIWAQVSAHAIVDARWRKVFRPKKAEDALWGKQFVEFICHNIFKELHWKASSILLGLALLVGCVNPGLKEREDYAYNFKTNLVAETDHVLAAYEGELTLSNAVTIAHERSLKLAKYDLEAALARVNRATAFSAFLPTVAFSGGGMLISGGAYHLPYLGNLTGEGMYLKSGSMVVAQPVFTPVAWTMFAESLYGVRIKDIVRERAQELLDIQVAALFYRAAIAERQVKTYELQLNSAVALTNRLSRLVEEGYALAADKARATAHCAVSLASLKKAQNERESTRGELAEVLCLWPLTPFKVDGDSILTLPPLPERRVEEWVWQGLITRKDLYAGDQTIEYRKTRVIEALAGFLPNIVLGGGGANASIEGMIAKGWAGSLSGVWAAFSGFRTVQQYRAAKAERESEYKLQEDRMLAVVVAVTECERNLRFAREQREAAHIYAQAAELDYRATLRRYEDGQEPLTNMLDKLAVRDGAEVKRIQADYAEALAIIQLRQAVGEKIL